MRFPNAAAGVKKIFTAELLSLIGAICAVIGAVSAIIGIIAAEGSSSVGGVIAGAGIAAVFLGATGVLSIIAFIFMIIGVSKARVDEESFKSSLLFLIIYIAANVLYSVFSAMKMTVLAGIMQTVYDLAMLCTTIFIITGIINLADKLGKSEVSRKGTNVLKVIVALYAVLIIAAIIMTIANGIAAVILAAIMSVIIAVLSMVQTIMYLLFLNDGKNMLAQN